jgi:hypothetical protein
MLDPETAIGLASSVISFVQFAGDLISGASEVYKSASGNTAETRTSRSPFATCEA